MKLKNSTAKEKIEEATNIFAELLVLEVERKFLEKLEKNKQNETEKK